jgi:competence protein ComEA
VPELPFELSRRRIVVAVACLALLLFVGSKLLAHPQAVDAPLAPPAAAPVETTAAATAVVVDVVGAVRRPGLYRLEQGARIADAVSRAGGATPKADLALINLAAPLADGEQVVVPKHGAAALGAPMGAGGSSGAGAPASGPVHLSTATLEQLDSLPGIGPVTAQKILDYRQKHGAFTSVDELDAVPGIGPARLDQLKDLVAP